MAYHPFGHPGLKLLSVAIAVLLWFTVSGEEVVERSLRVPLELRNIPDQLELVDSPPVTVDVRVRGTTGVVSHLDAGDVVAVLDLSSGRPGRRLFHLTSTQVQGPLGVEVVQVNPATIPLTFERTGTKSVPVEPVVEGTPASGYTVGAIKAEPAAVDVEGPVSLLEKLTGAITEAVSVADAEKPVAETVAVGIQDVGLRLRYPVNARVTVAIVPIPVEQTIPDVPVDIRNIGAKLTAQATPPAVKVVMRGAKTTLDGLKADAVGAFVDALDLRPGRHSLRVRVEPIPDVEILRVDPASVQVRIR
jgi:YbbR domain-containing protein